MINQAINIMKEKAFFDYLRSWNYVNKVKSKVIRSPESKVLSHICLEINFENHKLPEIELDQPRTLYYQQLWVENKKRSIVTPQPKASKEGNFYIKFEETEHSIKQHQKSRLSCKTHRVINKHAKRIEIEEPGELVQKYTYI